MMGKRAPVGSGERPEEKTVEAEVAHPALQPRKSALASAQIHPLFTNTPED